MSQNPKIPTILFPGIIGSTSPEWAIFFAIIYEPASPKPSASNAPIFIIVCSRITVS